MVVHLIRPGRRPAPIRDRHADLPGIYGCSPTNESRRDRKASRRSPERSAGCSHAANARRGRASCREAIGVRPLGPARGAWYTSSGTRSGGRNRDVKSLRRRPCIHVEPSAGHSGVRQPGQSNVVEMSSRVSGAVGRPFEKSPRDAGSWPCRGRSARRPGTTGESDNPYRVCGCEAIITCVGICRYRARSGRRPAAPPPRDPPAAARPIAALWKCPRARCRQIHMDAISSGAAGPPSGS